MNRLVDNVIAYDFVHPGHKLQTRWPVLDGVHRNLVSDLADTLSERLQFEVTADVEPPILGKYSDYAAQLPGSTLVHEFALAPLAGATLFSTDNAVIAALVDAWFGGNGRVLIPDDNPPDDNPSEEASDALEEPDVESENDDEPLEPTGDDESSEAGESEAVHTRGPRRDADAVFEPPRILSSTEQRLYRHVLNALNGAFKSAWQPLREIEPEPVQALFLPRVRRARDQVVVVCRFSLKFKEGLGRCAIVYPHATLKPLDADLSRDPEARSRQDNTFGQAMQKQLLHCELDVNAVLAELKITLGQVLAMKPGDFIPLRDIETVSFKTQQTPLFDARLGVSNGRVSASLQRWRLPEQS